MAKCREGCTCGRHRMKGKRLPRDHRKAIKEGTQRFHDQIAKETAGLPQPDNKRCSKCGEWKSRDHDFRWKKTRNARGKIRRYPSGDCLECEKQRTREWREKKRASGELKELERRYDRNRNAKKRRERQVDQRVKEGATITKLDGVDKGKGTRLPREPLAEYLLQKMYDKGWSLERVADWVEMDENQIRRIVHGKEGVRSVTLDLVDRILLAFHEQELLHDLYPID